MMETEREQAAITELKKQINLMLNWKWSSGYSLPGGTSSEVYIQRIKDLTTSLKACSFEGLPPTAVGKASAALRQTLRHLGDARDFYNAKSSQAVADTDKLKGIIDGIESNWYNCWEAFSNIILYVQMFSGKESAGVQLRHAIDLREQVQEVLEDAKEKSDAELVEIKRLVEDVRLLQSKGVIAAFAGNFAQEAEYHLRFSIGWAVAAILMGMAIIFYVDGPFSNNLNNLSGPPTAFAWVVQHGLSRLAVVSLLTYALVVAVRNFSASWHNRVVNRHRLNAFGAFEKFANTAQDQQTKDAVLLEATRAVFAPQTTGYLKGEAEPAHGSQIVEIIRSMAGDSKH